MSISESFKALPKKSKNLLILGITFALFIALPLFVWSIINMKFDVRERAIMIRVCTPRPACLDLRPPCMIQEPADGWCPTPTPVAGCSLNCIRNSDCLPNLICVKPNNSLSGQCKHPNCTGDQDCICPTEATATATATSTATSTATATATSTSTSTSTATSTSVSTATATATATATSSPTTPPIGGGSPNSCGGTCGSNYNCQANFFCFEGHCRNPLCKTDTDCKCSTSATATASAVGTTRSGATRTSTPNGSPMATPTYLSGTGIPLFGTEKPTSERPSDTAPENQFLNKYAIYIFAGFVIVVVTTIYLFSNKKKSENTLPHITPPTNI